MLVLLNWSLKFHIFSLSISISCLAFCCQIVFLELLDYWILSQVWLFPLTVFFCSILKFEIIFSFREPVFFLCSILVYIKILQKISVRATFSKSASFFLRLHCPYEFFFFFWSPIVVFLPLKKSKELAFNVSWAEANLWAVEGIISALLSWQ